MNRDNMSMTPRVLLSLSVAAFAFGTGGIFWSIGLPLGAIPFGLFLISKLLENEALLFDSEQRVRVAMAEVGRQDKALFRTQDQPVRKVQLREISAHAS
jgi:hypothetical protein